MKKTNFIGFFIIGSMALNMLKAAPVDSATVAASVVADSIVATVDSTVADSIVLPVDSVALVADSVSVSVVDSVANDTVSDVFPVALRSSIKVDSTALLMEKVKAMTDMISVKSLLNAQLVQEVFSDTAIVNKYNRLLVQMSRKYAQELNDTADIDSIDVNPLYYRLFAPLVLYKSPMSSALGLGKSVNAVSAEDSMLVAAMTSGRDFRLLDELDCVLLYTYLNRPTSVLMTEDSLRASQSVAEEVIKGSTDNVKLDVGTTISKPLTDVTQADLTTNMVVHRPNFWRTKGKLSTQMTESFFSPNWYQGGTNNINMFSTMTLEANYNNKKKTQWENKLEARIGFYQNEGAEIESNQDLLRLTSKLNLKAIRNWNYTIEAQGNTQMMQHFNGDNTLKSRFLAPVDGMLTVGMDFKKNFSKGSISVFPGPLSYKMSYVAVKDLATNYGIEEGKRSRHDIGSKLEVRLDYKFTKNISYNTRFFYYTPYEYVQVDWENTFEFRVNKYISTKLFFHARFDDHVARNDEWGFFQFKEFFTFSLDYSW